VRSCGPLAAVAVLVAALVVPPFAAGQVTRVSSLEAYAPGERGVMYVEWGGALPIDGLKLSMPAQWKVTAVSIYSAATGLRPGSIDTANGQSDVVVLSPIDTPCTFLVEFVAGPNPGSGFVDLVPTVRSPTDLVTLDAESVRRPASIVRVPPVPGDETNHVASFSGNSGLEVRRDQVPSVSLNRSHTVSLWLRTTSTDEVILSDWTGVDADPYDLELMVSADGSLASYRGRPGHHESMISSRPIADGRWHHVAVSYDANSRWSRLHVDGATVDSIITAFSIPNPRMAPLVLGRRVERASDAGRIASEPSTAFTGYLDDVAFWSTRLSASALHEQLATAGSARASDFVIDFEGLDVPEGGRLISATVGRRDGVHELRAGIDAGTVELTWVSQDRLTEAFVVERSYDGTAFTEIGRISPVDNLAGRYTFVDRSAIGEVVFYRISQRFVAGGARSSATIKIGMADVMETPDVDASSLNVSNFPNPFRESTSIHYELSEAGHVELSVWDLAGQPVATLIDAGRRAGSYEVDFEASALPAGTYFVRLQVGDQIASHKLLLIK
jgi:hypothetical protein